jgi:outer membrane biosynthesis protein TonB
MQMIHAGSFRFAFSPIIAVLALFLLVSSTLGQEANPAKSSGPQLSLSVQLLTDPEGVDLSAYVSSVYKSVKARALATIPPSVARGDRGAVSILVTIQKDGRLASPALPTFVFGSGKKALDDHAMASVYKAAPFDHLPEQLSAPSVELRLTFYYNQSPPSSR